LEPAEVETIVAERLLTSRAAPRSGSSCKVPYMNRLFSIAAQWTARQTGRAHTFIGAIAVIVLWAATGPMFGFSDTWQLIINTGTTIITFLMVFLIQNTQNRDTTAIQLKLDELIRVNQDARNRLFTLEDLSEEELERVKAQFAKLAKKAPTIETRHELEQAAEEIAEAREKLHEAQEKVE
jgi:low affinity Fe/Cu permease